MTKHTPATPLPFTAELDALTERGEQYIVVITDEARKLKSVVAKVNGSLIAGEHGSAKELSAYITHAANAYPKLVEALRTIKAQTFVDAEGPELRAQNECNHRRASALLRELGEE